MVTLTKQPLSTIIVLCPNRSASWQQTKLFIFFSCSVVLIVALAWSFVGAWLVLPFAGIEMLLLAFVMYRVCYQSYNKQVITISGDTITVESGVHRPDKVRQLDRKSTHLAITEATNKLEPASLYLKDDHGCVRIGTFLNKEDVQVARGKLQQAGLLACSNHWWKDA